MRTLSLLLILTVGVAPSAFSQTYTIQTIAGRGWDMPGISASLSTVSGVAADSAGNIYMALREYAVVVRMDASGQLTLIAGNGVPGYSGDDGPAILAQLRSPDAVAVDGGGNVYVADAQTFSVRKISNGVITTVAGGGIPFVNAVPAIDASGIALDSAGNLYIAASGRILKVSGGVTTTVAGPCCSANAFGDNIPAVGASLSPSGIAVDAAGNLYIADTCSNRIRKVSGGMITTVAGNGTVNGFSCAQPAAGGDGRATGVSLDTPAGIALDAAGNVYFTEGRQHIEGNSSAGGRVRKVSNGNITTVAGGGVCGNPFTCAALSDNIPSTGVLLSNPSALAIDAAGSVYVPDAYGATTPSGFTIGGGPGRLRKVSSGVMSTVAGTLGMIGDGGPAMGAQLDLPAGIAVDAAGNLYIADSANNAVREVSNGVISTFTGNGLYRPRGVALDAAGFLYATDGFSIVRLQNGSSSAPIGPQDLRANIANIALDGAGNLYIADTTGNRVLELSNGGITTLAGDGTFGFGGDGGPAASAELASPSGVAVDSAGNLYITDLGNQRVRKIANGTISTVAGNGTAGFSGDNGPAIEAQLNLPPLGCQNNHCGAELPAGIAVDAAGDIYIADSGNHRVRKVSGGVITTLAGNGTPGFSGDNGPAGDAQLDVPSGIAVDVGGQVYVADSGNNRIRVLIPTGSAGGASADTVIRKPHF